MKIGFNITVVLLCLNTGLLSQNLTGTWEGTGGGGYYKLVILHINDSLFGYTYDTGLGFCKANFIGTYNQSTKKLAGKNTSFIEKTFFHALSTYQLTYSKNGAAEYLKGRAAAKSVGAKIYSFGIPFPISYIKMKSSIDTTKFVAAKIELYKNAANDTTAGTNLITKRPVSIHDTASHPEKSSSINLKNIKESRLSEIVQTITTAADTVRLVLYDNGEIDGDTVTVFLNGKLIIEKLGLDIKPFETRIAIPRNGKAQVIELMADNLGSIPPNTAYMQLWSGSKKNELRLSSDFSTNARIDIQYKPE